MKATSLLMGAWVLLTLTACNQQMFQLSSNAKNVLYQRANTRTEQMIDLNTLRPRMMMRGAGDMEVFSLDAKFSLLIGGARGFGTPYFDRRLYFDRLTDLRNPELLGYYDPSAEDPNRDYCYVYPTSLHRNSAQYTLFFSAVAYKKGGTCPTGNSLELTNLTAAYYISFPRSIGDQQFATGSFNGRLGRGDGDTRNLPPVVLQPSGTGISAPGVLKIDPFVFGDRLLYVASDPNPWTSGLILNSVEMIKLPELTQGGNFTPRVREPASNGYKRLASGFGTDGSNYNGIAEGPAAFQTPDQTFLLYQANLWGANYSVYYKKAPSIDGITEKTPATALMKAIPRKICEGRFANEQEMAPHEECFHRNYGISNVIENQGQRFVVYHVLDHDVDHTGYYLRDTWIGPLYADEQNQLISPTTLSLRLVRQTGFVYTVGLRLVDGSTVPNCLSDERFAAPNSKLLFNGLCDDGRFIGVEKIAGLEIQTMNTKTRGQTAFQVPVRFDRPEYVINGDPNLIFISWNKNEILKGKIDYSLDAYDQNDQLIGPCLNGWELRGRTSVLFDGNCRSANRSLATNSIKAFRICAAADGRWDTGLCTNKTPVEVTAGSLHLRWPIDQLNSSGGPQPPPPPPPPAQPDLVVSKVELSPSTPKVGTPVSILLTVQNRGGVAINKGTWLGAVIKLRYQNQDLWTRAGATLSAPLAAAGSVRIETPTAQKVLLPSGVGTIEVWIDDQKIIGESNETNNYSITSRPIFGLQVNRRSGYSYSFDLRMKDGRIIPACLHDWMFPADSSKILFSGVCDNGTSYDLNLVQSVILVYSKDQWKSATGISKEITNSTDFVFAP